MNTFKSKFKTTVMVSLLLCGLKAHAFGLGEDAIEADALRITLNNDGTGFVQGKICDACKSLTVAITPKTKAFDKEKEVPLQKAADRLGKPATVFINPEHTKVTRITW